MTLLAPGFRTATVPGWRAAALVALGVAVGRPILWLYGALGFAARGGLVVLALPMLTIPSPVVLSTLFRGQLSTSGLAPGSEWLAVVALGGAFVVFALALLAAAWADVAAFEAFARDPDTAELRWETGPRELGRRERSRLVLVLATVQAVALLPALLAGLAVAMRLEAVFLDEWILPSDFAMPFFLRVAAGLAQPLLALAATLVLADLLYALASRALLTAATGLEHHERLGRTAARVAMSGALRLVRRPGRTFATAVVAWAITLAVLVPVAWAASVAWNGVRSLFLSGGWQADPAGAPGVLTVTAVFAGIWIAATILAGFTSAARAALWSADALR
jgi:hypothetical protein